MKTWPAFVANWVVNDYAAIVKRHGPPPPERFRLVSLLLACWYLDILSSTAARAWLRRVATG